MPNRILTTIYWKSRISILGVSECDLDIPRKMAKLLVKTTETRSDSAFCGVRFESALFANNPFGGFQT